MLPPPLWTVIETPYFLVEFHEEIVKRASDLLGAKLMENQKYTNPFKKWKDTVRVEHGDKVDKDVYGNPFEDDFQGMFNFWSSNICHYNEIFLEDVDGEGKQKKCNFYCYSRDEGERRDCVQERDIGNGKTGGSVFFC